MCPTLLVTGMHLTLSQLQNVYWLQPVAQLVRAGARSDQANLSPVLEGEGSIPCRGGEFSPLTCYTNFWTGCRGISPVTVLRFALPSLW